MDSIRLRNLRSLTDTGYIPVTPLVVLVGQNSSGKSSFLRTLPLLRQSLEQNTKGPILWYGQYVDFGSFSEALSQFSQDSVISFEFSLDISADHLNRRAFMQSRAAMIETTQRVLLQDTEAKVCLSVRSPESEISTVVSQLDLNIVGHDIKVCVEPETNDATIFVNSKQVLSDHKLGAQTSQYGLFPRLYVDTDEAVLPSGRIRRRSTLSQILLSKLANGVSRFTHGNTSPKTHWQIARQIPMCRRGEFKAALLNVKNAPDSWYESINTFKSAAAALEDRAVAASIPILLDHINDRLARFFSQVRYIKPVRATAERYYRQQDLSVEEIDSQGANVPMYLDSLSISAKRKLAEWLKEKFGFSVESRRSEGHVAIRVTESRSELEANLADMGFGYSQLLPLAIQLWAETSMPRKMDPMDRIVGPVPRVIAIEQPELHLHPELQSKLADVFVATACAKDIDLGDQCSIFIETHSKHIVNRLGLLISEGRLRASDVSIVLFDSMENEPGTNVRMASFDDSGALQDWPYGFFEPSPRR